MLTKTINIALNFVENFHSFIQVKIEISDRCLRLFLKNKGLI